MKAAAVFLFLVPENELTRKARAVGTVAFMHQAPAAIKYCELALRRLKREPERHHIIILIKLLKRAMLDCNMGHYLSSPPHLHVNDKYVKPAGSLERF